MTGQWQGPTPGVVRLKEVFVKGELTVSQDILEYKFTSNPLEKKKTNKQIKQGNSRTDT